MPCVQAKIQDNQAALNALVLPSGEWKKRKMGSSHLACSALIDTGATASGISWHAAKKLGIMPHENKLVQGVHGLEHTNLYSVDLILPDVFYVVEAIILIEANFPEHNKFHAVIGMDIISMGTLHFNYCSSISPEGVCTFCV